MRIEHSIGGSERNSLLSPCTAPRGKRWLSLGPALKKKYVKQIEGVQWRAAPFVKNCYKREPETVTNLLNELNWIPLKERRTISRLTLFRKAIHDDGGLAFPHYVMKRGRNFMGRLFDF